METNQSSNALMPVATRPPAIMTRGAGSYLWDASGRRYLDFVQGWAVNSLGHAPAEVCQALQTQAATLITASPAYHNAPQLALAERLAALSTLHHVFFTSTGAEANEGAVKLCRKWGRIHKHGAFEIVTTHGAFHGRTLATMAASGKPGWDDLFPPPTPGFVKVPFGDPDAMEAAISDGTVALMVEPIQGEGGVVVPPAGYVRALRALADRRDLLLVLDEVQTGIGRTGTMFAFEAEDAVPDILTLGKGIGGGVPLAALVANERASCFAPGDQGGTYSGNSLMTAVGLAVVDTISAPSFLENVRSTADYLQLALEALVRKHTLDHARGRGLLQALELRAPNAAAIRDACLDAGLLINAPRPTTLRLMPSLRVSTGEIDEMIERLDGVFSAIPG